MNVQSLMQGPIDHVGYVVDDIAESVDAWAKLGVGPFLHVSHVQFDQVSYRGQTCVFDHSAAVARWGDIGIELQQIHHAEPEALGLELGSGRGNGVNHVAYACTDPLDVSRALEELGYPVGLASQSGPIEEYMHFVPQFGITVEVHLATALAGFWAMVAEASQDWDGSEPLRALEFPLS